MNNIMPLPALSASVATAVNCTEQEAEELIRIFFSSLSETLAQGHNVKIKGLGSFTVIDDDVRFMPDTGLADAVNLPFAAFEAVELPDDFDMESSMNIVNNGDPDTTDETTPTSGALESLSEAEEAIDTQHDLSGNQDIPMPVAIEATDVDTTTETESHNAETAPELSTDTPSDYDNIPYSDTTLNESPTQESRSNPRWFIAAAAIACILCFGAGYFLGHTIGASAPDREIAPSRLTLSQDRQLQATESALPASSTESDSTKMYESITNEVAQQIQSEKSTATITDTIGRTRFLTTMSRQHYGRMEFWVYIYEENASKLGNPNNLSAGTIVIIPPAEKYGIDANNPASVAKAVQRGKEIYAQFN